MSKKYDKDYLNRLISEQEEENLHLEYKAADALGKTDLKKREISKDVSAMANSDGGLIIYGINENPSKKHLPENIDPISRMEFSKEWLEQVITSNIHPKVKNIVITPVPIDDDNVVYVVKIPKGDTAHQASDKRYYKRYNFESVAMDDYEVKDIINRNQYPIIELEFEITKHTYEEVFILGKDENDYNIRTDFELEIFAINNGKIFANYINFFLKINRDLIAKVVKNKYKFTEFNNIYTTLIEGDNSKKEIIGYKNNPNKDIPIYGPNVYEPLLPGMKKNLKTILLTEDARFTDLEIYWIVYADNAIPKDYKIKFKEIKYSEYDERYL